MVSSFSLVELEVNIFSLVELEVSSFSLIELESLYSSVELEMSHNEWSWVF